MHIYFFQIVWILDLRNRNYGVMLKQCRKYLKQTPIEKSGKGNLLRKFQRVWVAYCTVHVAS